MGLVALGPSLTGSHRGVHPSVTILSSHGGCLTRVTPAAFGFLIPSDLGVTKRRLPRPGRLWLRLLAHCAGDTVGAHVPPARVWTCPRRHSLLRPFSSSPS